MDALRKIRLREKSVALALLVTLLWSSSWVLIKLAFSDELGALTFAGLRYVLACICLAPLVLWNRTQRHLLANLPPGGWLLLFVFGITCYGVAQGALFLALQFIPAAMTSLLLNLTPGTVAIAGMLFLREYPTRQQWSGILAALLGIALYFSTMTMPQYQLFGMGAALVCMLANTSSTALGRYINSRMQLPAIPITFISMGFGSVLLLTTGLILEGIGALSLRQCLIIGWLAIVNTALAWSLWNQTLRNLTAVESSVITSLMLPQTVLLAMLFLGERISWLQAAGLTLVGLGAVIVQIGPKQN